MKLRLDPELTGGVFPISKAASSLAALIKRARGTMRPVIVTQKGYPTGVILGVEQFAELRRLAERAEGEAADVRDFLVMEAPGEDLPTPMLDAILAEMGV